MTDDIIRNNADIAIRELIFNAKSIKKAGSEPG
jgi:hypothetical protein